MKNASSLASLSVHHIQTMIKLTKSQSTTYLKVCIRWHWILPKKTHEGGWKAG